MRKEIVLLIVLSMFIIISLCGCNSKENPILKVITTDLSNNTTNYSVINDNGSTKKTESFIADQADYLYADSTDYTSRVENGKIIVELKKNDLIDSSGEKIEANETVKTLMQEIADKSQHSLLSVTIIIDDETYFAFVKHNVNLWAPCILYKYDVNSCKLIELYCWDNVELVGISLI